MLWGYAITGIIGIAGTSLGAWLTGRRQTTNLLLSINAENQRFERAEKRQAYVACNAAFHNFFFASGLSLDKTTEPSRSLIKHSETEVFDTTTEVSLIAPENVSVLAVQFTNTMLEYAESIESDRQPELFAQLNHERVELVDAMRADLRQSR
jgi:hypothetical protein